ncbi:ABC transporter permease [Chamaesiphon polymorphus]|uniref:ABC transporter permease n=1 Tax=Chamaesiphon polymorphus CCALA 037 TaxID=2107692 RepID=A0A2T1GFI3_9CYAN|nr:ABC transporter permease [Chamaesiphon polymorphus]PSB56317.1 ABC transporter permease [Chamaesiphon polymorphus CCALA 037]
MSLIRIWAVASNVFREVMRERIFLTIGFYAVLMLAAWQLLPAISGAAQDKILTDFGTASSSLLGVVITIFVGTNLINKEIEKRTVFTIVTKPISSIEFILGKHLGLSAVLAILVAGMTVIYLLVLTLSQINYQLGPLLLSSLFLFLELCLIAAASLLFGVFTSSILAILLTFSLYLVGHLSEGMVKLAGVTKNPGFQQLTDNLYLILPDLSRLNLKNDAVYGVLPPTDMLLINAGYALVYTTALLVTTTVIFSRRQF